MKPVETPADMWANPASWRARALMLVAAWLTWSCGGSAAPEDTTGPIDATDADVTVLMMGNSHTAGHDLPQQLQALLRAGLAGPSVRVTVAPGWMFLDERLADAASTSLLRNRRWTLVVLQAQKYSTTGTVRYSTTEAEQWVQMARTAGALPVMFPEWPRRAVDETDRIYQQHVAIAQRQPACVAPIGQAWDLALRRDLTLALHASDGNHSTAAGAFLSALVLYATATGASPLALPAFSNGIPPALQAQLRQVAADTVQAVPPRQYCAADPTLLPTRAAVQPQSAG